MVPVQDGKRLGRGKGYYDSYLKQIEDKGLTTKTIGELSYVRVFTMCAAASHVSTYCQFSVPTPGQLCLCVSSPCLPGPDVRGHPHHRTGHAGGHGSASRYSIEMVMVIIYAHKSIYCTWFRSGSQISCAIDNFTWIE